MSDLETNGPDVPVRPTQGGDERLTRGIDNELAWTPDPEPPAPAQLTPDDITNATANAGTVSGEQLATLKPAQLTPDDIANATENAGTVSGEQLAALGGGGSGPEILKDWTFVADANGTISLLGDLVLGASGLDKLTIEYDDLDAANATGWKGVIMVSTETAGGTVYSEIRTQAFNSLGGGDVSVISDGTYPMSPVLSYGNYPVTSAKGTLEITERERTNNQIIMIYGEAQTLSSDANGNGMRHNATRYVAGVRTTNTNKINNILFDTSGMGATSFRYRIIRKQ